VRLLVTGAQGMLGHRVVDVARNAGHEVTGIDVQELDITDADATVAFLRDARPEAVVNCAAYTAVDRAEEQEDLALAVNGAGAGNVAAACAVVGARIVHVSTDYVFDGARSDGRPYVESDATAPQGAYGRTKLAGERAVAAHNPDHAIARTAWLFGRGGPNFVDTMLRLGRERDEVQVVCDQVGSPTWTGHLAPVLVGLCDPARGTGLFHTAGDGRCSWHALCVAAFGRAGLSTPVRETTSAAFVRPAPRPAWSVLATERAPDPPLPAWEQGLAGHLEEVLGS
jgi:dTDP-4-dehydrorhamnose reductase